MEDGIIIIGSGVAGLSAALQLAENGAKSLLISEMPSERAQSVMAEGGINAAVNLETDSPELHAEETLRTGRFIADPDAVHHMTKAAPEMIEKLYSAGMAFTLNSDKKPDVRAFGGQSVKRTFYAASNTGKQLMYVLIDQARRYEAEGMIKRLSGWLFFRLLYDGNRAYGCILEHSITQEKRYIYGKVIIASGGMNGLFGNATGSIRNTGSVTATLFASGLKFANGEFIQYHPTTVKLHGKNMLITEAVRGEGGRLYVQENRKNIYFMEEKYPELGNLMPRDVVAREEWEQMQQGKQIYLDMRHLDKETCNTKLRGVVEDCIHFLSIDPRKEPIPVVPGIHYFMGGIWVDVNHRTSMQNVYAAGECACQYHGANRLGGNSLLGAMYGGMIAARSAMADETITKIPKFQIYCDDKKEYKTGNYMEHLLQMQAILRNGLGIIRNGRTLQDAISKMDLLIEETAEVYDKTASEFENQLLSSSCLLGKAILLCADARKESRGSHVRSDYPKECIEYQKQTIAKWKDGDIQVCFQKVGEQVEN